MPAVPCTHATCFTCRGAGVTLTSIPPLTRGPLLPHFRCICSIGSPPARHANKHVQTLTRLSYLDVCLNVRHIGPGRTRQCIATQTGMTNTMNSAKAHSSLPPFLIVPIESCRSLLVLFVYGCRRLLRILYDCVN